MWKALNQHRSREPCLGYHVPPIEIVHDHYRQITAGQQSHWTGTVHEVVIGRALRHCTHRGGSSTRSPLRPELSSSSAVKPRINDGRSSRSSARGRSQDRAGRYASADRPNACCCGSADGPLRRPASGFPLAPSASGALGWSQLVAVSNHLALIMPPSVLPRPIRRSARPDSDQDRSAPRESGSTLAGRWCVHRSNGPEAPSISLVSRSNRRLSSSS